MLSAYTIDPSEWLSSCLIAPANAYRPTAQISYGPARLRSLTFVRARDSPDTSMELWRAARRRHSHSSASQNTCYPCYAEECLSCARLSVGSKKVFCFSCSDGNEFADSTDSAVAQRVFLGVPLLRGALRPVFPRRELPPRIAEFFFRRED